MTMRLWVGFFLFWLVAGSVPVSVASAAPIVVTDDAGFRVELAQPARRIVSLAPHVTEMLFAAGAGQWIVGAVSFSDYPPQAEEIPRVGSYNAMDLEAIIAKQPDLVVAWGSGNPARIIDKLKQLGVNVYITEPQRLALIPDDIERLGRLTGQAETAAAAARQFRQRLRQLQENRPTGVPVRVFYQIWDRPLMTIGGQQMISEVLSLCGGRNIFADLNGLAPQIDLESVLAANPEAIIFATAQDRVPQWRQSWLRWPQLEAVRRDNVFALNPDLLHRHGPRIIEGAEALCQVLDEVRARR